MKIVYLNRIIPIVGTSALICIIRVIDAIITLIKLAIAFEEKTLLYHGSDNHVLYIATMTIIISTSTKSLYLHTYHVNMLDYVLLLELRRLAA